jgi:hypothetical protein
MDTLYLTDEEIQRIILIGRRFLINESTHPDDLKAVLFNGLREGQPALAAKIAQMDKQQMTSLCHTILAQQQSHA